jgi:microcin C transport system substrate-binding protein
VLLIGHYMVPQWYKGSHNLIYWNKFSRPKVTAPFGLGIDSWWVDAEKQATLNARGKAID